MSTKLNMKPLAVSVAVLLAAAGSAVAQQKVEVEKEVRTKQMRGSLDQPLRGGSEVKSRIGKVTMSQSSSMGDFSVKIEDGKISATVNGEELPADRIVEKGDSIELLSEGGQVLARFPLPGMELMTPRTPRTPRAPGLAPMPIDPPRAPAPPMATLPENPPPVMLGITMSSGDDIEGVRVDSVIDGLPAAKGGVQVGDVIVSADGKNLDELDGLRGVLQSKKPGEKLKLVVKRGGEEKTIEVTLDKFDRNSLISKMPGDAPGWAMRLEKQEDWYATARKALEEALAEVQAEVEGIDVEKIQADAEKALHQAMKALEEAKRQSGPAIARFFNEEQRGGEDKVFGDRGQVFVVPAPSSPGSGTNSRELNRQLERLTQQLDRLNERLDQMERRLDRADRHNDR